ncbi:MAG: AmmeMemoRadiSam system protein A [Dehalococcoidales bacterium]|nr:AmmeMemoRadiSam system protein A [Dehalococcoidales bacterium]
MSPVFGKSDDTARCLVELARDAVEAFVKHRQILEPARELPPTVNRRAGVFVCLKKFGELRGCIGTFEPTRDNVAEEIVHNAVSAAVRDPRFPPVSQEELKYLSYSVDILTPYEPVEDLSQLDPRRYGVIVQSGFRRGLLLPDLEGIDSAEEQVNIASRKAGISPDEPLHLFRFEVERYE